MIKGEVEAANTQLEQRQQLLLDLKAHYEQEEVALQTAEQEAGMDRERLQNADQIEQVAPPETVANHTVLEHARPCQPYINGLIFRVPVHLLARLPACLPPMKRRSREPPQSIHTRARKRKDVHARGCGCSGGCNGWSEQSR